MIVHLIDGTYELFRHFYGLRRASTKDKPFGAVAGVLGTVIQMLEEGATHIGVATDHIIESFRNELWPGYKFPATVLGDRMESALLFKKLATLRTDAPLFTDIEALRWRGATEAFACVAEQIGAPALMTRIAKLAPMS